MANDDNVVTCGLLDYINRTANANSEEDLDFLLELMRPTSRNEMSEIYEKTLGYNPITYFDEKYLYEIYDDIMRTAPDSIQNQLRSSKDKIISKVMDIDANITEDYLKSLLLQVIKDETGWASGEMITVDNLVKKHLSNTDYLNDYGESDEEEEEYDESDDDEYDEEYDEDFSSDD